MHNAYCIIVHDSVQYNYPEGGDDTSHTTADSKFEVLEMLVELKLTIKIEKKKPATRKPPSKPTPKTEIIIKA